MDEENKMNETPQNLPTGFDSVSNITNSSEENKFNPTPMFSKLNQNENNGYTVTPEGNFFTQSPNSDESLKEPMKENIASQNEDKKENINKENATAEEPAEAKTNGSSVSNEERVENIAKDFLPNGTYSYSAAKGNLPDSAKNEPVSEEQGSEAPRSSSNPFSENAQNNTQDFYQPHSPAQAKKVKKAKKQKGEKRYGGGVIATSVVLAVILGFAGGFGGAFIFNNYGKSQTDNKSSASTPQNITNIVVDETVNSTVEAVAKKAGPSVIGIRTTAAVNNFFFGSSESTEEGSGIVYSSDGYIITNYHVIESAVEASNSKVEVFLPDDTENSIEAAIVGYNISYDLAVVKISAKDLTPVEFADSDKLSVGQNVIAIGNPGGLEFIGSVSTGVISGLNRSITVDTGSTMSLIQTDAAINPGNSGGALVNTEGKLIGVNSVKLVSTGFEGMGFAIPSNKVKEICDKIISKENTPTPYIGIQISQTYTASQLKALGYPAGAVVSSVVEDAPADEAGIQRGDIITEFNGTEINNYTDIDSALRDCSPGDSVTVKLYRAGRLYSTNVNIEANNAQ